MIGGAMEKQLTTDEVQDVLKSLESYIVDLKARWDQENPNPKAWFKLPKSQILAATKFIINCLDELINFVETVIPSGSDKKLAVLAVTAKIFDYIVANAFPLWMKPFASTIRMIVINIVVDYMIDFIVDKYNAGFWKQEATDGEKQL
jgi:hypothetical protein